MRNLKLVIFLGKLNNLELWGADIGNAYLEAPTEEKLYIVAGPEFEDWEGYILTFSKALYGLRSSGKRWAKPLHDVLKDMNFMVENNRKCCMTHFQRFLVCCFENALTIDLLFF